MVDQAGATALLTWGKRGCEVALEGIWTAGMVRAAEREMQKALKTRHVTLLRDKAQKERAEKEEAQDMKEEISTVMEGAQNA